MSNHAYQPGAIHYIIFLIFLIEVLLGMAILWSWWQKRKSGRLVEVALED